MDKIYRILVINPGSTSTKLSMFENETCLFTEDVFHDSSVLKKFPTINDQLDYRMEVVDKFLKDGNIDLTGVDAIVGRGGGCYSVEGGIYKIDDRLIQDTKAAKGGLYHSSMLGVQMADVLHKKYGGIMIMMNPPIVDELCDLARVTGVDGVYRRVVCHIAGGISITAHKKGKMIDGNDAGGGEGPFTPTRMGTMAVTDITRYFWDKTQAEMKSLCSQTGGLSSYFGTSNSDAIHKKVEEGDRKATRVWNAMIYQVIKYIGSMSTVLQGKVDGIVLTGGLLRFPEVEEKIRESCGWIAPVTSYPGEFEQEAMAFGALRVLRGEEEAKIYPGKPVWDGFKD